MKKSQSAKQKDLDNLNESVYDDFLAAVCSGQIETVRALLPFVDPKADQSEALGLAAWHYHPNIFELLFPVSNPSDVSGFCLDIFIQKDNLGMIKLVFPFLEENKNVDELFIKKTLNGKIETAKAILPLITNKDIFNLALKQAAKKGDFEAVVFLLPFSDPKTCTALNEAARENDIKIVRLLAPLSDVKQYSSSALWWATEHENQEMIDYLYPMSDGQAVVDRFEHTERGNKSLEYLKQRIKADLEKSFLNDNIQTTLNTTPPRPSRKKI